MVNNINIYTEVLYCGKNNRKFIIDEIVHSRNIEGIRSTNQRRRDSNYDRMVLAKIQIYQEGDNNEGWENLGEEN